MEVDEDVMSVDAPTAAVGPSIAATEVNSDQKDVNNDEMDVAEEEEPEYEVETIKEVKLRRDHDGKQRLHFYVKWKGYPDAQSTWEPFENLDGSSELRDEYLKNYREQVAQGTLKPSRPKSVSKQSKPKKTGPPKKSYDFVDEEEDEAQDTSAVERVEQQRRAYELRQAKKKQQRKNEESSKKKETKKAYDTKKTAQKPNADENGTHVAMAVDDDISEEIEVASIPMKTKEKKEPNAAAESNGKAAKKAKNTKNSAETAAKIAKAAIDRETIKRVSEAYFGKLKNEWDVDRFDPEPPQHDWTEDDSLPVIPAPPPTTADVAPPNRRLRWKMLEDSESHKKRKLSEDTNGADVDIRHEFTAQALRKPLDSITKYLESNEIPTDGTETQLRRRWLASHLVSADRHVDLESHYMIGTMGEDIPARKGQFVLDNDADINGRVAALSDLDLIKAAKRGDAPITHVAIRLMHRMDSEGLPLVLRASASKMLSLRLHSSCLTVTDLEFAEQIRGASSLEVLELSSSLRLLTCVGLKQILSQCPRLRELNLAGHMLLSDESAQAIADYCPWLEVLILESEWITPHTMLNIALQCPFLRVLHVNNASKITMKAVTLMVQSLPLLRIFSAQNSISSFDPARQDIFQRKFNALMKEKDIQGFL